MRGYNPGRHLALTTSSTSSSTPAIVRWPHVHHDPTGAAVAFFSTFMFLVSFCLLSPLRVVKNHDFFTLHMGAVLEKQTCQPVVDTRVLWGVMWVKSLPNLFLQSLI
jgi:hypothetical protein